MEQERRSSVREPAVPPGVHQHAGALDALDCIRSLCTKLRISAPCRGSPVFTSVSNTHGITCLLLKQGHRLHQLIQCPDGHVHLTLMSNSSLEFLSKPVISPSPLSTDPNSRNHVPEAQRVCAPVFWPDWDTRPQRI